MNKLKDFLDKHSKDDTPKSFSNVFNTKDSSYQVRVLVDNNRGSYTILHFRIPDEFSLEVTASWTSLVNKLINDLPSNSKQIVNSAVSVVNVASDLYSINSHKKAGNPIMSAQTYSGSSPLKLHFDFDLSAYGSAVNEILDPIKALIAMTLPSQEKIESMKQLGLLNKRDGWSQEDLEKFIKNIGKGVTWALPGPGLKDILMANNISGSFTEGFAKGTSIYVQIASYFLCGPVFIRNIKPTFRNRLDSDGRPTMAKISIDFETAYTMTANQLLDCFI
jgi:hypothetical protein